MNTIDFPVWYQSTTGPQVSQTIFNILGSFIPVINMALASKGIVVLPEAINFWVNIGVFSYFSVRALFGYLKAKKSLGQKIDALEAQVTSLRADRQ